MSNIILYDETLEVGKTAFITPNDKIIVTDDKHEVYAQNYCNINNLTKEELILYKRWLQENEEVKRKMSSDFLVCVLGFDKILSLMKKTIVTTSFEPHIRFYNYYLMDWYIDIRKKSVYNEKTGMFELVGRDDFIMKYNKDRKVEVEIDEIKKYVKLKDRHHFLK